MGEIATNIKNAQIWSPNIEISRRYAIGISISFLQPKEFLLLMLYSLQNNQDSFISCMLNFLQNTYTISINFLINFIIKYILNNTSNNKVIIISDHIINNKINKWIISTFVSGTQMSLLITWNYIKLSHGASLYVILS